ncbi:MAG: FMN-binding protein, partial [Gemmatimonadota bacterium]|nr:FMN-binding protein [Gemmatimonadota bacterium]
MQRPHSRVRAHRRVRTRVFVTALFAVAGAGPTSVEVFAQELRDIPETLLRQVLPRAERFDDRSGDPLVFRGWAVVAGEGEVLVGYAFHTADIPPERRGYSGPVETLIGMDLQGRITGVRITDYWESISSTMGDFLRRPGVQEQFTGKRISDGFSPRDDVRAVSRATISTRGLALGIRDAARRVANAYLATSIETTDPLRPVEELSWYELQQRGVLVPIAVSAPGNRSAEITLAYMESAVFAERLVGPDAVAMAERYWAETGHQDHVFFYGLDGTDLQLFRREGWAVIQDGDTLSIPPSDFHPFGLSSGGLLADQLITGGVLIVDGILDVERAFRFQYHYAPTPPPYSAEYRTE